MEQSVTSLICSSPRLLERELCVAFQRQSDLVKQLKFLATKQSSAISGVMAPTQPLVHVSLGCLECESITSLITGSCVATYCSTASAHSSPLLPLSAIRLHRAQPRELLLPEPAVSGYSECAYSKHVAVVEVTTYVLPVNSYPNTTHHNCVQVPG